MLFRLLFFDNRIVHGNYFESEVVRFVKRLCQGYIFLYLESLILAQNERWQRGLGMQVERESMGSSFRTRTCGGEWRKGEEHVGNLPSSWE